MDIFLTCSMACLIGAAVVTVIYPTDCVIRLTLGAVASFFAAKVFEECN